MGIVQGLDGRLYQVNVDPQYNKHPRYAQYSTTGDESNKFVPDCCTNDSTHENFDNVNLSRKEPVQPKFSTNDTEQIQETTGRKNTNTSNKHVSMKRNKDKDHGIKQATRNRMHNNRN